MELREYLSIRRAYNLVRQGMGADRRLTFVEFAILCRMTVLRRPMNTSEIAEYQGSLRPTMTHRTKHLAELGLMSRSKGVSDRRNVVCEITDEGEAFVSDACRLVCDILRTGTVLSRSSPQRICRFVDAMGAVTCLSGDLVLLGISASEAEACTVSDLVAQLGLLQPTVSMSVSSLERAGLVRRARRGGANGKLVDISLTETGRERSQALLDEIDALSVRRRS
ncbi:MAG: MarR family transcriptional regulator [Acidobacteriota bacterium]|nr:MarR family transcriptional regulator [Acidobacteriota bacterium]